MRPAALVLVSGARPLRRPRSQLPAIRTPSGSRKPLCPPACPRHTVGILSCGSISVRPPPCPHRPVSRTAIPLRARFRKQNTVFYRFDATSLPGRALADIGFLTAEPHTADTGRKNTAERGKGKSYGQRRGGRKCRNVPVPPHLNGMARKTERKKCFSTLVRTLKIFGCQ